MKPPVNRRRAHIATAQGTSKQAGGGFFAVAKALKKRRFAANTPGFRRLKNDR